MVYVCSALHFQQQISCVFYLFSPMSYYWPVCTQLLAKFPVCPALYSQHLRLAFLYALPSMWWYRVCSYTKWCEHPSKILISGVSSEGYYFCYSIQRHFRLLCAPNPCGNSWGKALSIHKSWSLRIWFDEFGLEHIKWFVQSPDLNNTKHFKHLCDDLEHHCTSNSYRSLSTKVDIFKASKEC